MSYSSLFYGCHFPTAPFLCYLYFLIHPRKTLHTDKTAEIIANILIICRSLSFIIWFLHTLGNHINTTVISHDTRTIILNIIPPNLTVVLSNKKSLMVVVLMCIFHLQLHLSPDYWKQSTLQIHLKLLIQF